jgi:hypothetical protein
MTSKNNYKIVIPNFNLILNKNILTWVNMFPMIAGKDTRIKKK